MRVAIVGLGQMGRGVAGRLLERGHTVSVWNRSPGKAEDLVAQGATEARSAAQAASAAEVVIAVLSDDRAVREVVLDDGGVAGALPPDALLVDMSTVSPDTSRAESDAVGGRFIDAPILGGPPVIRTGQATLFIGGPDDAVDRLGSLWDDLSARHVHTGPAGSAVTLKILSNLLLIGGVALLAEVLATGQGKGISNEQLRGVFGESPMVAPGIRNRFDDVLEGDHHGWFSVNMAAKDVRLALDLAHRSGIEPLLAGAALTELDRAASLGLAELDFAALVEAVRGSRASGTP